MFQTTMRVLSTVVSLYLLILIIRIILSWFRGIDFGKAYQVLSNITDPYLNYFRRFKFLRMGTIDFSPILGFISLVILQNIFENLSRFGTITPGILGAIILQAVWAGVAFFLVFFIILFVIRLIVLASGRGTINPFWSTIDTITEPILYSSTSWIIGNRPINHKTRLLIGIILFIVYRILGGILVTLLIRLMLSSGPIFQTMV